MSNVDKIQQAIIDGASLEEALELAKGFGIEAHIEDDLLVLDGVIFTAPEGGDIEESASDSIEEALEEAWQEEAEYHSAASNPVVVAVKAFNPAFTIWGMMVDFAPEWKIKLLPMEEPKCSAQEHSWEWDSAWAGAHGGTVTIEKCSICGATRNINSLWQDPATGTVWERVVTYDSL